MVCVPPGVVAGMLGLSRSLGPVAGAPVMGAVFALASGAVAVATAVIVVTLTIDAWNRLATAFRKLPV
jgi:hypothetical protein